MDLVFITDSHFKSASRVRTGDFLDDTAAKLQFVVDYCNKYDAILLHGGDVFDSPSVPDLVKNKLFPIFRKLKKKCYAVAGNHCRLYGSEEYDYKTSYQTLVSAGLVEGLDNTTVDLGECFITNELPVIQRGKPQVVVYHGYLNIEDGVNTFHFQDMAPNITDRVYVCLGHDHLVYEPLQYTGNIKIFRPGSFSRMDRDDNSMRNPQLLHIRVNNGKLSFKMVDIQCRPAEEIFTTKLKEVTKAQQRDTYDAIISQIRDANSANLTFEQAIQQVAPEDVCTYANKLLTESRLEAQHEKSNL